MLSRLFIIFSGLVLCISCRDSSKNIAKIAETHVSNEEHIQFISKNDTLIGYLSKPSQSKTYPLIVVLHSASHGHHDNDLYNHLEKTMNSIGIGVFTYDRRGSGESQGDFNHASLDLLAEDALNAIDHLKQREDIQKNNMGLFGISQGGWLAPLAYHLKPNDISFMVLVSSSGVSPARQMEYSAVTTLKLNGYSNEIIEKAKYLRKITNSYYRGKRKLKSTQLEIDQYRDENWFADVYLPWRGNLPEDVNQTKWIHEMDFNPENYFRSVNIPIKLFYGETDRWVPIEESIVIWEEILNKNNNSNYEINRIKSAGHMMIHNEDKNSQTLTISSEYTQKLKNWVLKQID